uniref:Uncharacterized protein LOC111115402 n=1 Tax=Crassostrea virginica TaxID=6565 RepID=A0A8B8C2M6_CRAVI|nr:uncharacterized protein LOC111115402 [Crassostrea virginica]
MSFEMASVRMMHDLPKMIMTQMTQREIPVRSFEQLQKYFTPMKRSMIHCATSLNNRSKYKHHFILLGHTWVEEDEMCSILHYATTPKVMVAVQPYYRGDFEENIEHGLFIYEDDKYPKNEIEFDKAYDRFESRKGERNFNIATNNCEHLANYIMTGVAISYQVENMNFFQKMSWVFDNGSSGSSSSASRSGSSSSRVGRNMPSNIGRRFSPSSAISSGRSLRYRVPPN